jgi:hypothetical protein
MHKVHLRWQYIRGSGNATDGSTDETQQIIVVVVILFTVTTTIATVIIVVVNISIIYTSYNDYD